MSFEDINAQRIQHDSGAIVGQYDRETIRYILGDRTWYIDIERTTDGGYLSVPTGSRWDNGDYLTADEISAAVEILKDAFAHWKRTAYIDYEGNAGHGPIERREFRAKMRPEELARTFPLE